MIIRLFCAVAVVLMSVGDTVFPVSLDAVEDNIKWDIHGDWPDQAVLPVVHKRGWTFKRSRYDDPVLGHGSSSSEDPNYKARLNKSDEEADVLNSQLITLKEPFGQYFAVMALGTPASEIALILDTGSEVLWVQCQPCHKCGIQARDPIFDPSTSLSYRRLRCSSRWCNQPTTLAIGCPAAASATPSNQPPSSSIEENAFDVNSLIDPSSCFYNASYGDDSVSFGELSMDTLTLASLEGKAITVPNFVFGCGIVNTGVETDFNASGLIGLDRGPYSIISQLQVQKFSYCLPDRTNNLDATGYLAFGGAAKNIHAMYTSRTKQLADAERQEAGNAEFGIDFHYVRLLHNNKTEFYAQSYYVNLTGIRVGEEQLSVDASLFEIDPHTGNGGTIVDTGSSLTSLVDALYLAFRSAMRRQVEAVPVYVPQLPGFDMCYSVPRHVGPPTKPQVRLQFEGAEELAVPPSNTWLLVGFEGEEDVYCLAFSAGGQAAGGRNVIGNFQQQNLLVEVNLESGHVAFAHVEGCASGSPGWAVTWQHLLLSIFLIII